MFRGPHMRGLAQEKERAGDTLGTLRRLLRYFIPYAWILGIVLALLVLGSVIEVAGPYLLKVAVDQFIVPQGTPPPWWLAWLIPSGIRWGSHCSSMCCAG
jgi:ATP-binding cassette subfamily B multidrug efflux pump